MDKLNFSHPGGPGSGFVIEGFPEGVKFACPKGGMARRISHLGLHRSDLTFAEACLQSLARPEAQSEPVRSALWYSAVLSFMKCFGNSKARFRLDQDKIYAKNKVARESFAFFKAMRNKHFAHDENAFLQAHTGAVINGPSAKFKVARILTFVYRADVLGQDAFANLRLLIEGAKAWVVAENDKLCDQLSAELERLGHDQLLALPNAVYTKPNVEDATKNRR